MPVKGRGGDGMGPGGGGGGVVEGREVSLLHATAACTQLIYGCGALNVGGGLHEISCCAIFPKVPAYCVRV